MNQATQIPRLGNPIWSRLKDFRVGNPNAQLTFVKRLARENRWSPDYAQRVFDEYKQFVFLAVSAGHPVTPSDQVDQAWHLHLVYTQSYWMELCGEILNRPLHHGPTRGGVEEDEKFHDWYEQTLESYERIFGHEPPADIWPAPAKRFAQAAKFARLNAGDYWLIKKPAAAFKRAVASSTAAALLSVLIAACSAKNEDGGLFFIILVIIGLATIFILAARSQNKRSGHGGGGCGAGCGSSGGDSGSSGCGSGGSSGCGGGGCGGCGS